MIRFSKDACLVHVGSIARHAQQPVWMTYRSIGTGPGRQEFTKDGDPVNSFGTGDVSLASQTDNSRGSPLHVPFGLHSVSFFHTVPGYESGQGPGLNLTSCTLARIFLREIRRWDADEIVDMNPDLLDISPQAKDREITVVRRSAGSSSTFGITNYLNESCPEVWNRSTGLVIDDWPSETVGVPNSGGMVTELEKGFRIGYLESGQGRSNSFPEVRIKNRAGHFLTSQEANLTETLNDAYKDDNSKLKSAVAKIHDNTNLWSPKINKELLNRDGSDSFPIIMLSTFFLDGRSTDPKKKKERGLWKLFVDFALSDEGQKIGESAGFSTMPSAMRETLRNELDSKVFQFFGVQFVGIASASVDNHSIPGCARRCKTLPIGD